jgi:ADP-heptose:LPS heptosyltransferase
MQKLKQHRVNGRPAATGRLGSPAPRRIVVVRALPGLGDFLCAVPAWRALRRALAAAEISLIGLESTRPLAQRFHAYIDDFIPFSGFPGIVEQPFVAASFPAFLHKMQERRFDLALQMHGNGTISNLYTLLLGAQRTAGFYLPPNYCPDRRTFLPYSEQLPEVRRHLALLSFLGIPHEDDALEFPLQDEDREVFAALARRHKLLPGEYVCLHPGAQESGRRWPSNRFAAVAGSLLEQGWRVVLTGTAAEASLTRKIAAHFPAGVSDLSGQTTLGSMALLLRHARLLICNDTGVSHLAAAMEAPSVVIFTHSSPARWAPLNHALHRPVGKGDGHSPSPATVLVATGELLAMPTEVPHV